MATLTSPGVSVTITNESFYSTAGEGTVPFVVIATAENKPQPGSTTALASGTIKSEAGKLNLITSQRDALQKFGSPTFYKVAGTPQYDNELNEVGLFALYEYLGIANQAYVIRADVDLNQLVPSSTEPTGIPTAGSNWLDLNNTTWGVFKGTGNVNSAYNWQSKSPLVPAATDMETIVQGNRATPLADPISPIIAANGTLTINLVDIAIAEDDSLTSVVNKINNNLTLNKKGITATVFVQQKKFYSNGTLVNGATYGDVYNLRIVSSDWATSISLSATGSILTELGLTSTTNHTLPKASYGVDGDIAVDVYSTTDGVQKNNIWQKIAQTTITGTTAWWFKIGSTNASYPGWGWREAAPRVITGTIPNPTFTAGEEVSIAIDHAAPFTVTLSGPTATLDSFIADLNEAFNGESVNVVAKKNTVGNNSYLQIVNYDGTDIWLHDDSNGTLTQTPFADAGISTSQSFFGSVTGTVSNPTFTIGSVVTIDIGSGSPVNVTLTGTTLDSVIADINSALAGVASKVTSGADNYLKLTNPNSTNFTVKDASGMALNDAGIPVGYTFGKKLMYKGYSPSLTVPSLPADLAADNIWINTTPQNRGANIVVKQYRNGTWTNLNVTPNTGTIPMYDSDAVANSGFGAAKANGSVYLQYNANNNTPTQATHVLKVWNEKSGAWIPLSYTPSVTQPAGPPAPGTYWYNTTLQADIMVSDGQVWQGYKNAYPATDPNGPILSASAPIKQSDDTDLVDYDIWIDTSDVENYPKIYRYNATLSTWDLVDNTDHTSAAGIIFADARANVDGTATGSQNSADMILSDWVDPDAPSANIYPRGLMLFNTRYSTNNVKVWTANAVPTAPYANRWVSISSNKPDGTPYMGHWAQRNVIVSALKAAINANQDARAEQTYFNLIACPGYTECIGDLVELNADKKDIAFVLGDTPARLTPDGTSIQNWATNAMGATGDGPDGLVTRSEYAGIYYPWGLSTNLDGSSIFVPPTTMALRTYAYNDQVAYPWFAPAGYNRGLVTGVSSVGYLTAQNTFQFVQLSQGQRDVLYSNEINPIAFLPNRGLVVYGQKTLASTASAMDRVNVARLVNYLNYQLDNLAKPFLFEPNDVQTRRAVTTTFTGFIGNLVGLRAIYDFAVVCDETNNTPERIDRNELWIDIAIKPEKAIEFIYIPVRLLNTGEPLPGANRVTATV